MTQQQPPAKDGKSKRKTHGLFSSFRKTEIPPNVTATGDFLLRFFLRERPRQPTSHSGFGTGNMKSVLITGASGLLGRSLVRAFDAASSWTVVGLAHSRVSGQLVKADLTDVQDTARIVQKYKPNVIVHSAAQRFPDKVESDYAASYELNVTASKNLAALADAEGAAFIFISTDYVFDGRSPPYQEGDEPNPLNKYGKTKAEAEKAVLAAKPDAIILRIPVLYGGEEYDAESAVSVLLQLFKDPTKKARVSDYEIRYPSHTQDIASIVVQLSERRLLDSGVAGVFHWCGLEPLTKFQMVLTMAEVLNLGHDHLSPDRDPSQGAPRPHDCRLECGRLRDLGIGQHTRFSEGVKSFARFLQ